MKQIPRDDEEAIRPSQVQYPQQQQQQQQQKNTRNNNNNNNSNNNNSGNMSFGWKYNASGNNGHSSSNDSNDTNSVSPLSPTNVTFSQMSDKFGNNNNNKNTKNSSGGFHFQSSKIDSMNVITQQDLDEQIRRSWVRGAVVEVYSRGRKKWLRGLVMRVFHDDEGEWLEVRYGKNLVKEIPRDSPDIRPLRVKLRPKYKFTVERSLHMFI